MTPPSRLLELAIQDNVSWCEAVCRAHGRPGETRPYIWLDRFETPPFYANAITLTDRRDRWLQLHALEELRGAPPSGTWSVKDSYAALDLAPLGFHVLFEATWIARAGPAPFPETPRPGIRWARVTDARTLAAWEAAWQGPGGAGERPDLSWRRVFPPALLRDTRIAFIAALDRPRFFAGGVATAGDESIGISNVFAPPDDLRSVRAGCEAVAASVFGALPFVGYERGRDLDVATDLGYERLGPLRVWQTVAG